ncbi:hypothetical protein FIM80_05235 [Helicobacter pylori]|uniref:Uncharacterized protein n=1 Tax=Helicobacter pylori TaxID=210 RepID=A0A1V3APA7_HELPX|nr:hypothetical protein HMPREF1409_00429 [Helicobacter pylori GAM246Ai]KAA6492161.1 hypothetical protein EPC83_03415 [Helicobacter pylori]KAA6493558.1 hypothetical protein EPC79_07550 [Helicobacter pylori]KAA6499675.1 hypothetical protein EPC72_04790 [Helicobacter pylori]KAA6511846.1 hypothetical protein EPC74_02030 [Helicobacter pylori]
MSFFLSLFLKNLFRMPLKLQGNQGLDLFTFSKCVRTHMPLFKLFLSKKHKCVRTHFLGSNHATP